MSEKEREQKKENPAITLPAVQNNQLRSKVHIVKKLSPTPGHYPPSAVDIFIDEAGLERLHQQQRGEYSRELPVPPALCPPSRCFRIFIFFTELGMMTGR